MATKNIVPRANGEGGIGTSAKRWLNGFFKNVTVDTSLNTVTPGNSDNSTKAATTAFVENTFFDKLVAKLLATTAATITSLSTSSLFYRFLAQALSVAGVQYNLSNSSAWYICLGSLFGGLIIQGGRFSQSSVSQTETFPISYESPIPPVLLIANTSVYFNVTSPYNRTQFTSHASSTISYEYFVYWISMAK